MNWPSVRGRLLQWHRKEQGSFTLESTLVFPLLLTLILLFLVFGMYMYQKVQLYYAASSTAERAAFGWDNSHRDPRSGMLTETKYDGLYWRIGEDEMLGSLFGLGAGSTDTVITLPQELSSDGGEIDLSQSKMLRSVQWLERAGLGYKGEISYSNRILKRKIEVKLKQPLAVDALEQSWLKREPKTVSAASVVDPVEFIRSVDLMRYYSSKFADRGGGAGPAKAQAGKVLATYQGIGGEDELEKSG
ncbi:pilus assembly protein [Paenibacillus alkaliterrae]|uniref:TadE/TadG family type IV pilus assembly protein n=1 Tax=Paenibacillus alkaliterrae TaxID=320909 RepID=UPI001F2015F2|nr:TadE/TadG family type IV pilus assembly protein [Paenibacillus alkaliterrae]MCF2940764.1 pilus assembly protein [Paenibacillus alkaliterrae]